MPATRKPGKSLLIAVGFLLPNIVGVLTFVIFPLLFSIVLTVTNWDLTHHNMFKPGALKFVGLDNFIQLIEQGDFLRYLGNTLFMMMAIPFAVGGSLIAAILLSKDPRAGGGKHWGFLAAGAGLVVFATMLTILGMGSSAMTILLAGVACIILIFGMAGGNTIYRTFFYMPHFCAGVATFILWQKLYNPEKGPINQAIAPILDGIAAIVRHVPAWSVQAGAYLLLALILGAFTVTTNRIRRMWDDGDAGTASLVIPTIFLLLPSLLALVWGETNTWAWPVAVGTGAILAIQIGRMLSKKRDFGCQRWEAAGSLLVMALFAMVVQFVFLGLAPVLMNLPHMVAGTTHAQVLAGANFDAPGLAPPKWIYDYNWAKPSLMIVGLWGAIGSNNMLLYLAALSNIPDDLYEAANIDGASRMQKFWNVTWPQLAPTTFFIAVMATIGGLQGGFEIARVLTQGGPDGATTTLSYFIYQTGFQEGRLSYASATAWTLFILILCLTLINWRFGNRYVNE